MLCLSPRSACCFLPTLCLGQGTLDHWSCSLQGEHSPCTRALSGWALQWISTRESCTYFPLCVTSHPMQGCSKIQARIAPEDTQYKQEFMPIFSTAWLSVGLIPRSQNKVLNPFLPAKAESRSSLCLSSVFMCNWTGWQEPLNAPKQDRGTEKWIIQLSV